MNTFEKNKLNILIKIKNRVINNGGIPSKMLMLDIENTKKILGEK